MEKIESEIYFENEKFVKINKENKNNYILFSENGREIRMKDFKNFTIYCECGNSFSPKKFTNILTSKKWICKHCRSSGENNGMFGKHHDEESKLSMSRKRQGENNSFYGKHHSEETKNKISEANKGKLCGDKNPMYSINVYKYINEKYGNEKGEKIANEMKLKLSKRFSGENNPFYGKHHSKETKNKISNILKNSQKHKESASSLSVRKKISDKLKNRFFSEEHRINLRLAWIHNKNEFIKKRCNITGDYMYSPNYNKKACEIFDKISKENNIIIRHAMNGGEYYIKELGYWVDGYDYENNVVYEFDERRHFEVNGELKEKDRIRQRRIENLLKCKFIRIKYDEIN